MQVTQPKQVTRIDSQTPATQPNAGMVSRKLITFLPHAGFLLGVLMWVVDATVDSFILNPDEEFWEAMFAEEPTEMWMRSLVIIVITIASLFVQYYMRKQHKFEMLLLEQKAQLEGIVFERTSELQRLANFDTLTGIYNRRKFREILEGEMERAKRYVQPLSLAILDIDHFKKVNDCCGHSEGDKVLESFAEVLRKNLRQSDYYARWGGEEFIVLMSHTDLQTAEKVAEKLRILFGAINYGNDENISASIGIASQQVNEEINSLIRRADEALYIAKNNGRNCVRVK